MFYFTTGILVGLFVLINGILKFKENKILTLVSSISGVGLITSGILGFIFKDLEFVFNLCLVGFAGLYIVYSLIAFKKNKKK